MSFAPSVFSSSSSPLASSGTCAPLLSKFYHHSFCVARISISLLVECLTFLPSGLKVHAARQENVRGAGPFSCVNQGCPMPASSGGTYRALARAVPTHSICLGGGSEIVVGATTSDAQVPRLSCRPFFAVVTCFCSVEAVYPAPPRRRGAPRVGLGLACASSYYDFNAAEA